MGRQVLCSPIKKIQLDNKIYTPTALIDEIFEQLEETLGFTDETYNQLVRGLEKSIQMETPDLTNSGDLFPWLRHSKIIGNNKKIFKEPIKKLQEDLKLQSIMCKKKIDEKNEEISRINQSRTMQEKKNTY